MILFLAAPCLAACRDLPEFTPGVCGNGVLEEGERCDIHVGFEGVACGAPDAGAGACEYVCDDLGGSCPPGWTCGVVDGVCRVGNGTFGDHVALPSARLRDVAAVDVDGDLKIDVVGAARVASETEVWFGDGQGGFGERHRANNPAVEGRPLYPDLDGDGAAEVVLPTAPGVFVQRGTSERTLEALAYPYVHLPSAFAPGPIEDFIATPVLFRGESSVATALVQFAGDPRVHAAVLAPGGPNFADVGTGDLADLAGGLAVGEVDPLSDVDGSEEVLFGLDGASVIQVLEVTFDPATGSLHALPRQAIGLPAPLARVELVGTLDLPPHPAPASIRLFHRDADGVPDVMAAVRVGTQIHVAVARGRGDGTFNPAAIDPLFDSLVTPPAGCTKATARSRWPLAAGRLDGDAHDDFVSSVGLHLSEPDQGRACVRLVARPAVDAPWVEATIADFNRDGRMDVAALGATIDSTERVVSRALDVVRGDGAGRGNRTTYATSYNVTTPRTGDFDGDFTSDLAYLDHDAQQLMVSFGDLAAPPTPPAPMARISGVEVLGTGFDPTGASADDRITDVFALARAGSTRTLTVMVGTPERRLLSPFGLTTEEGEPRVVRPETVVAGSFRSSSGYPDLLVIARDDEEVASDVVNAAPFVFLIKGTEGAAYGPTSLDQLAVDGSCDQFPWDCALFGAADLDGDDRDELVAAGWSTELGCGAPRTLYRAWVDGEVFRCDVTEDVGPDETMLPTSLSTVDVDGDLRADVLLTYTSMDPAAPFYGGGAQVAFARPGGPEIVDLTGPFGDSLVGAVVTNVDDDMPREVLLVTGIGWLYRSDRDPATGEFGPPMLLMEPMDDPTGEPGPGVLAYPPIDQVVAADVDSDGLDDLILSGPDGVYVRRQVPDPAPHRRASDEHVQTF